MSNNWITQLLQIIIYFKGPIEWTVSSELIFVYAEAVPSAHLCHSSAATCSHSQSCGQCLSVLECPLKLLWAVLVWMTTVQDKGSLWFSSGACGFLSSRRQIPNLDLLKQKASPNPSPAAPAPSSRLPFFCHVSPMKGWMKTLAEDAFSLKVLRLVCQKHFWVLCRPWDKSRADSVSSKSSWASELN